MPDVIQILSDLVAVPSVSSQDNVPVIDLISSWFTDYKKTLQDWVQKDDVPGKNLIVHLPGEDASKSLVFVCHMDTVPSSSKWDTDPFTLTEKDGKLFGLGSCDTKGGTASLIKAVLTLSDKPKFDTFLVFSGDEEVSAAGVKRLKEDMDFKNPSFVFLEPTERKVLIAQRGLAGMEIETHGEAQHGSFGTPENNRKHNAIYKMSKLLDVLVEDAEKLALENNPILGSNTQNLGVIKGGTARNVMADRCLISFDRRLLPSHDPKLEIERLSALAVNLFPDTKILHTDVLPSFSTPEDAEIVQHALKNLRSYYDDGALGGFQAWSEAGLFASDGDVIILGPGSIAQAHRANEFVPKKELEDFVNIFQKIITGV